MSTNTEKQTTSSGETPAEHSGAKVTEGKATIYLAAEQKVFYNPIQQFNRDLSVTAIRAWSSLYEKTKIGKRESKPKRTAEEMESGETSETQNTPYITILEALSASGLRALRYGHEIPKVKSIIANDLLEDAVAAIDRNITLNGLNDIVTSNKADAIHYMSSGQNKFHVIDLDPYGTATPFIDGAIQSIKDEGLLLVTCTDAGVLAGSGYPEKCFALYGGHNFGNTYVSGEANHEAGLRLMLQMIASQAAKYKKAIEPLLCLSIDFYMRCFIKITTSPQAVKRLASKSMLTYHCLGCGNKLNQFFGRVERKADTFAKEQSSANNKTGDKFSIASGPPVSPHCNYCTSSHHLAGPMWGGQLHNHEFIDEVLKINASHDKLIYGTTERIKGMLTVAKSEISNPFYFNLNSVSSLLKTPPIPINDLCNSLGNLGYSMSLTHAQRNCIKTDAPWDVILQVNRHWLIKCNEQELIKNEQRLQTLKEKNDSNDSKITQKIEQLNEKIAALKSNPDMSVNLTPNQVGHKILSRAQETLPDIKVDFTTKSTESDKIRELRKLKLVRYQENPTKNWGPKARPQ